VGDRTRTCVGIKPQPLKGCPFDRLRHTHIKFLKEVPLKNLSKDKSYLIVNIFALFMKRDVWILILLISLLFVINYPFLNKAIVSFLDESETGFVERVIDGDTIVINGSSIRMLGINAPEKGEKYFKESKEFLENLVLNKTVKLRFGKEKTDKYRRTLAYIFLGEINVNELLIEKGFANYYFPSEKDKYYNKFLIAWEKCVSSNKNICERSKHSCVNCLDLEKRENYFLLKNSCKNNCDLTGWTISGEGRKIEVFPEIILEISEELRIHDVDFPGDIFVRDSESMLVLWKRI
jgi:micrococcal nuclease